MLRRLLALAVLAATAVGVRGQPVPVPAPKTQPATDAKPDADKSGGKEDEEKEGGGKGEDKKEDKKEDDEKKGEPTWYSVHGQSTVVTQGNSLFRAPYSGRNSLNPLRSIATTATATLFLAARTPWEGGEVVVNPEMAGGVGLSGTTGLGGFPNGEATRAGIPQPTPYFARALYRQTIGLGGGTEEVADGPNQPAGTRDKNRLVWTAGKFAATDVLDGLAYSHDPRTQFLNWSLMYNGAWDYPANVRGYTYGFTGEWYAGDWAVRYGGFGVPKEANGADIAPQFLRFHGQAVEVERRHTINERPGRVRVLAFLNRADMGDYRLAVAQNPAAPDITAVRAARSKYGFGASLEQELSDDTGLFARAGWNDGRTETWAFTEIDRTVSGGILVKGTTWGRAADRFGVAMAFNGLSGPHRDYLAAGGFGFIVGDGRLTYAAEQITELFYNLELKPGMTLAFDFQAAFNPAYNRDRGPVAIGAIRFHMEF